MDFIDGESLSEFISSSTQEEKNEIGKRLVEFLFTSLYKHNVFYSDSHYGNFIIKDKSILYVMDFGCTHKFDENIMDKLKNLHKSLISKDKTAFYQIVTDLNILNDKVTEESKEFMYEYFSILCKPWIVDADFEFSDEWLLSTTFKKTDLLKQWSMPENIIFLSKIPFNFSYILNRLNVKSNFRKLFNQLLE
jgi:predicted unusual protein kinase regulating ubiquinone biosynthesis (AarF/ABC1/UbiB family)